MYYTREDYGHAARQFWNVAAAVRELEANEPDSPEIASLYEDIEFLQTTAITWRIRCRCADMVAEWRRRTGAASSTPVAAGTGPAAQPGDREPA